MDSASAQGVHDNEAIANAVDRKVLGDLDILLEKMNRCQELLTVHGNETTNTLTSPSSMITIPKTNELFDIVGFLEACAPRMVELVEAAAQGGVLSDVVLMKALEVNDRLINTLSDLDGMSFVDEVVSEIQQISTDDEFDAFLSERTSGTADDLS
jgi:hypothetical protein